MIKVPDGWDIQIHPAKEADKEIKELLNIGTIKREEISNLVTFDYEEEFKEISEDAKRTTIVLLQKIFSEAKDVKIFILSRPYDELSFHLIATKNYVLNFLAGEFLGMSEFGNFTFRDLIEVFSKQYQYKEE